MKLKTYLFTSLLLVLTVAPLKAQDGGYPQQTDPGAQLLITILQTLMQNKAAQYQRDIARAQSKAQERESKRQYDLQKRQLQYSRNQAYYGR